MSAGFGTLDLPVRRTSWKGVTLVVLSAMGPRHCGFMLTHTVSHGSVSVTREAPADVRGGIENRSLYAPPQETAPAGGIENPSLYGSGGVPLG